MTSVLRHIVTVRPKPETTDAEIDAFIAEYNGLLSKIPNILSLAAHRIEKSLYPTYNDRSHGFQIVLESDYADVAALQHYAFHPAHQEFIENFVKKLITGPEDISVVDFFSTK